MPHDLSVSRQLLLPYWYWTEEDPRWSYLASPTRGGVLLPLRYYAKVVARLGEQFRDNSGADGAKNREHPGSQELMWGLGDYPVTPEAHMRQGARARRRVPARGRAGHEDGEGEPGRRPARSRLHEGVQAAGRLLRAEGAGGHVGPDLRLRRARVEQQDAERLADEAVARYEAAATFMWETIDGKTGNIKGRWLDGKSMTLPELIEREKQERQRAA